MAFNLNAIKALFGKLAPYADDAVGAVAKYGDDAARAVANYGDDALAVVDKVDDVLPDRTFEFTNPFGQVVSADYNKPGVWNIDGKTFHDIPESYALTNQNVLKEELLNKRTGLGKPDAGDFIDEAMVLGEAFPKDQLVESTDPRWRPHKNTALGRWFERNVPKDYKGFIDDFGNEYFIF